MTRPFVLTTDLADPIPRDVWAVATCSRCEGQRQWIMRPGAERFVAPDTRLRSTGWHLDEF